MASIVRKTRFLRSGDVLINRVTGGAYVIAKVGGAYRNISGSPRRHAPRVRGGPRDWRERVGVR
jgi:hypothetical protein